jgi:hypothetical protein
MWNPQQTCLPAPGLHAAAARSADRARPPPPPAAWPPLARELWHRVAWPGTLRGLVRATIQWACGRGFSFQWPRSLSFSGSRLLRLDCRLAEEGAAGSAADW